MAKILVVDDDNEARQSIVSILRSAGHTTEEAHDGIGALDGVAEHQPDLLLCNWLLPELFGGEVVQRIRSEPEFLQCQDLPIVMTSEFADETSEIKSRRVGADGFVAKTGDVATMRYALLETVHSALATRARQGVGGS